MTFRPWVTVFAVAGLLAGVGPIEAAACCAWIDKNACATCPSDYIAGCRTEGNKCECSCSGDTVSLIGKLSRYDPWLSKELTEAVSMLGRPTTIFAKSSSIILREDLIFTIDLLCFSGVRRASQHYRERSCRLRRPGSYDLAQDSALGHRHQENSRGHAEYVPVYWVS
jgi:hypothetical protein